MIVKFQSVATADVITFADVARALLRILGKEATARGVITPEEMPEALARLAALGHRNGDAAQEQAEHADSGIGIEAHELVALSQRAQPFIRMIDRAHLANKPVTWVAAQDFHDA
ncbi:hypothetical protein AZSI13_30050 [Azospira sp. I13]|uniref:DUF1840 domain-containing protein n=1 Tax=Azospira sp. I13 TaxID=1765050 RepID=UPI000D4D96CC|nr:DUF1840 domain-containing protein [Azospira sp. I13]GBG03678.1 hypothetical protein AZSI13_30050 [Azospira sp. I13]